MKKFFLSPSLALMVASLVTLGALLAAAPVLLQIGR